MRNGCQLDFIWDGTKIVPDALPFLQSSRFQWKMGPSKPVFLPVDSCSINFHCTKSVAGRGFFHGFVFGCYWYFLVAVSLIGLTYYMISYSYLLYYLWKTIVQPHWPSKRTRNPNLSCDSTFQCKYLFFGLDRSVIMIDLSIAASNPLQQLNDFPYVADMEMWLNFQRKTHNVDLPIFLLYDHFPNPWGYPPGN